jgi:hypothetical protein
VETGIREKEWWKTVLQKNVSNPAGKEDWILQYQRSEDIPYGVYTKLPPLLFKIICPGFLVMKSKSKFGRIGSWGGHH